MLTDKEIWQKTKYFKNFHLDQVSEKAWRSIKPGIVYILFENDEAVPADKIKAKQQWFRKYKKAFLVSKNNNIFLTRIAICLGCGKRRAKKSLLVEGCEICRNRLGYIKPAVGEIPKKESQRSKDLFEKRCRAITDCKKRVTTCLIKYQNKKFIPCYGCNRYVKMDLEHMQEKADRFKAIETEL